MIATAHQPSYLPWLGLIHKISEADVFISWDDVPMESSGFENRQRIAGGQWLTVPVHRDRDTKLKDVTIANEHDWRRKHLRSIEQVYAKARHWKTYEPMFRFLYVDAPPWKRLSDLADQTMAFLAAEYGLMPQWKRLSVIPTTTHKGEQVLEACRAVGARKYIFGEMGRQYANTRMFHDAGVEAFVQTYEPQPYDQFGSDFEPRLWAFDALLHHGSERAREIMLAGGRVERMS